MWNYFVVGSARGDMLEIIISIFSSMVSTILGVVVYIIYKICAEVNTNNVPFYLTYPIHIISTFTIMRSLGKMLIPEAEDEKKNHDKML